MELQPLRYVLAVARTGNFSRAAQQCHVSQPSLSQQIQKLEEELDEKLFDRGQPVEDPRPVGYVPKRKIIAGQMKKVAEERWERMLRRNEAAAEATFHEPCLRRASHGPEPVVQDLQSCTQRPRFPAST